MTLSVNIFDSVQTEDTVISHQPVGEISVPAWNERWPWIPGQVEVSVVHAPNAPGVLSYQPVTAAPASVGAF